MGGGGSPTIEQDHYRWYDDDSTDEDATTALALEDTTYSLPWADTNASIHLRIVYSNTGSKAENAAFGLEYNLNSAGWNEVTTTSSVIQQIAGQPTDAAATSQRLSAGTGTFTAGEYDDGDAKVGANLSNGDYTEGVWSIQAVSADLVGDGTDSIDVRLTNGGVVADVLNVTINLTVQAAPPVFPYHIIKQVRRVWKTLLTM